MMKVFKRSKRLFHLQDIGIFDLRFLNLIDFGIIIDKIRFVYINVNNFAEHF